MSVRIGSGIYIEKLDRVHIEGGQAPELDCRHFVLSWSTNINISAIKCKTLKIINCKNVVISGSVIDEIEVKDSKLIFFVGSRIGKKPRIIDSDVDYSMCIINIDSVKRSE